MSRSSIRYTRPLVQLFEREEGNHVMSMAIYCGCSDGLVREVELDWKLAIKTLGFLKHRMKNGQLVLSEGQRAFMVQSACSEAAVVIGGEVAGFRMPIPPAGYQWIERSDRRGEFECVPVSEEKVGLQLERPEFPETPVGQQ